MLAKSETVGRISRRRNPTFRRGAFVGSRFANPTYGTRACPGRDPGENGKVNTSPLVGGRRNRSVTVWIPAFAGTTKIRGTEMTEKRRFAQGNLKLTRHRGDPPVAPPVGAER